MLLNEGSGASTPGPSPVFGPDSFRKTGARSLPIMLYRMSSIVDGSQSAMAGKATSNATAATISRKSGNV